MCVTVSFTYLHYSESTGSRKTAQLMKILRAMQMFYSGSPFVVTDEIDLYMNGQQRHSAITELFSDSNQHSSRQLIYMTPMRLNNIVLAPDVKLIELPNPLSPAVA
jgi:hypothetical protein